MGRLEVIREGALRFHPGLRAAIHSVVAASFAYDPDRLDTEFERCDTLYAMRGNENELLSLFLVAWETLEVDGREVPALYMGVSTGPPDQNGSGKVSALYRQCISDAQEWEARYGEKLIAWATTMTPIVYLAAQKLFANTQPFQDGTFTERAALVAHAIGRKLGAEAGAPPFVFPRLAPGIQFRDEERRRIEAVCGGKPFPLFEQLGIDEVQGDRLLIVTEIPPTQP